MSDLTADEAVALIADAISRMTYLDADGIVFTSKDSDDDA